MVDPNQLFNVAVIVIMAYMGIVIISNLNGTNLCIASNSSGPTVPAGPVSLDTLISPVTQNGGTGNLMLSVTVGNHPNRLLIVSIEANDGGYDYSTVKIGSTRFTKVISIIGSPQSFVSEIWYLVNPPIGPQTITITPNPSVTNEYVVAGGISLYGANQINPIGQTATSASSSPSSSASVSLTPNSTTSWLIDSLMSGSGSSAPIGSDTTIYSTITGAFGDFGSSQYRASPSSGINTLSWSISNPENWSDSIVEVQEATSTSTLTNFIGSACNSWVNNSGTLYILAGVLLLLFVLPMIRGAIGAGRTQ